MIRRVFRRLARRAASPVRLWMIEQQLRASDRELERIRMMRADSIDRELIEQQHQVQLCSRRVAIERGFA